MKPTIGRTVHFTLSSTVTRPMIITNVNPDGTVNGVVFLDPPRDEALIGDLKCYVAVEFVPLAVDSKLYSDQVTTWHWPERVQ
jgi:hypothetical protein